MTPSPTHVSPVDQSTVCTPLSLSTVCAPMSPFEASRGERCGAYCQGMLAGARPPRVMVIGEAQATLISHAARHGHNRRPAGSGAIRGAGAGLGRARQNRWALPSSLALWGYDSSV